MRYTITLNGKRYTVEATMTHAKILGTEIADQDDDPDIPDFDFGDTEDVGETVKAQLPGVVIAVSVSPEQTISKGAVMLKIESMKMENEIIAPRDCRIVEVFVKPGESVKQGQALICIDTVSL